MQLAHRLADLLVDRPLQHEVRTRVVHRPRLADDRRAPRLAPGSAAELGRAEPRQALRRDGRPSLGVDLAGVAEALGHGQDGGEGDLGLLGAVVELELESQGRPQVLQAADPTGEGEIQQLGDLGPHLTRLTVDGVAAEEHEVEGAGGPSAAASARAVASVSDPANASSQTWTPESAPQATASRSTSSALGGPRVTTVHEPPVAPARMTPWDTARRQYAFISRSTPRRTSRPPSRRIDSATGTCLTSAAIRSGDPAARVTGAGLTGGSMRPRYWPRPAPVCPPRLSDRWRRPRGCAGPTPPPGGACRGRCGP